MTGPLLILALLAVHVALCAARKTFVWEDAFRIAYVSNVGSRTLRNLANATPRPHVIVAAGNYLKRKRVDLTNSNEPHPTELNREMARLRRLLDELVPDTYFLGVVGDNERYWSGPVLNGFQAYLHTRNNRISTRLHRNSILNGALKCVVNRDRSRALYGMAQVCYIFNTAIALLAPPTDPPVLGSLQHDEAIDAAADGFLRRHAELDDDTSTFRVCVLAGVPDEHYALENKPYFNYQTGQAELCRRLGAPIFSGSERMIGRTHEISNMRLREDPAFSPASFAVELDSESLLEQHLYRSTVDRYQVMSGRVPVVQIGGGEQAVPLGCDVKNNTRISATLGTNRGVSANTYFQRACPSSFDKFEYVPRGAAVCDYALNAPVFARTVGADNHPGIVQANANAGDTELNMAWCRLILWNKGGFLGGFQNSTSRFEFASAPLIPELVDVTELKLSTKHIRSATERKTFERYGLEKPDAGDVEGEEDEETGEADIEEAERDQREADGRNFDDEGLTIETARRDFDDKFRDAQIFAQDAAGVIKRKIYEQF